MNDQAKLDELVIEWDERREHGETVTAEELCHDCPELVEI